MTTTNTTTNKGFTFDFNFNNKNTSKSAPKVNQVSAGQSKYYTDLCKQKRLTPQPISEFNFDTMSEEIKRLLAYFPASDSQVELINKKIGELEVLVKQMNFTEEQRAMFEEGMYEEGNFIVQIIGNLLNPSFNMEDLVGELTGGKEGTASMVIEGLINIERQFTDQLPPSIPQLEMIVNMFLYPDANFEDYGVERRIDLGEGLWRKPTPEEFAEQVSEQFTKSEASKFIDSHRGGFYEWRQTRIRPEQVKYIQKLEARLCNDSKISAVQQAVTLDGTIIEVPGSKNESIVGTAYTPLTEQQLLMLSIEDASEFINQLKKETEIQYSSSLQDDTVEKNLRSTKSIKATVDEEFKEFTDLMFKLEAVAGYANDDLHSASSYNLVADDNPETSKANRLVIREFMKELLETGSISFYELIEMCKDSITAQRILLDM